MMHSSQTSQCSLLLLSFLLLLSLAPAILAQEAEDELEFNYIRGDERGPENWGHIKQEWATCKTGQMQSPIVLFPRIAEEAPSSEQILKSYQPGAAVLKNTGHDIELEWLENRTSSIRLNGTDYELLNCHWHSPSEHALNGRRYPLEVHFVHIAADNRISVIGSLYDFGKPDPFLSSIESKIEEISGNSEGETEVGVIDPDVVRKLGNSKYYRYKGSLTTPPCDEGVIWTVETKLGSVSPRQVQLLRNAVDDGARNNARPLQPINGRKVKLYKADH